jgi:hypothetical protein
MIGGRVGERVQQVATPTTDSPKIRLFGGKASSQVTTEDKRRLIEEVWGTSSRVEQNVEEWVWHGPNTSVEGVREGLTRIITDELTFCNQPGIDPMTPELPAPHDYAHWAYLLLDSGYGEVPQQVVAEALEQVGYSALSLRLARLSQGYER